jgi:hypothetical protein
MAENQIWQRIQHEVPQMAWWVVGIGVVMAVAVGITYLLTGNLFLRSGSNTRSMITAMTPSVQTLSLGTITGSATVLSLMLTIVSLIQQIEASFDKRFYQRIRRIALLCVIALTGATLMLALISIPLESTNLIDDVWYNALYYVLMTFTVGLSAVLILIVFLLYEAVTSVISVFISD